MYINISRIHFRSPRGIHARFTELIAALHVRYRARQQISNLLFNYQKKKKQ